MRILIVGGGIGGLTAALCLARAGHEVQLFEKAETFSEAGAGIQLSPNASRVLHDLGLEDRLRQVGFLPEGTQFRDWRSGKLIAESALGRTAVERFGFPYYHIHRGDLLALLVEAAESHPSVELNLEAPVTRFEEIEGRVRIQMAGSLIEGDLLIGADGIHSVVRSQLWGNEQPRFTGNVAWRALVPASSLPEGLIRPVSTVWWGPGKHFVHYYVKGGDTVNCVCVVEKEGWTVESWTERGDVSELKADFGGWHGDLQMLLDNVEAESLFKWALFDRPPMKHWGRGHTTLLGDACHPTLPFMAQGAAMAIEDSAVLTGCLEAEASVEQALIRYENLRRDRTAMVQKGSRRNATIFHLSGLPARARNLAAGRSAGKAMDELYAYNAFEAMTK